MNIGAIVVVLLLLALAYYYFTVVKAPKPLSVSGYADNEITVFLNEERLLLANDWTKKFNWQGQAKSGDKLVLVVRNIGGPGGLVCAINWDGKVTYSSPSSFQTAGPVGTCSENDVKSWWSAASLSGMEQAKWIWESGCVDNAASATNPVSIAFTYVLP